VDDTPRREPRLVAGEGWKGELNVSLAQTIREMDNLMAHIEGINDQRDLVPILLAVRERWPVLRQALKLRVSDDVPPVADG
jgi:hypothetical protein